MGLPLLHDPKANEAAFEAALIIFKNFRL